MSPVFVHFEIRAVCELLAEAVSTRIAALESFVQPQSEWVVRRLEQRMIEAVSRDGDWRGALFDGSQSLLQPVGATGAALLYEGQILSTGEVPGTQQNLLSPIVENAQLAALEFMYGVETARMQEMLESVRSSVTRSSERPALAGGPRFEPGLTESESFIRIRLQSSSTTHPSCKGTRGGVYRVGLHTAQSFGSLAQ